MDQGSGQRTFWLNLALQFRSAQRRVAPFLPAAMSILLWNISAAQTDSVTQAAMSAFTAGKMRDAARMFRTVRPDSMNERTAYTAGSALSSEGDFEASVRYLRRAHLLAPDNLWYLQQLGRAYGQLGNISESETAYKQILKIDSTYTPAITALGLSSIDKKDYAAAASYFSNAVRLNRLDFLSNYYYGYSLTNLGMPDSAYPFLVVSFTLNRRHLPTITLLASIYYHRKDYADASRLYEQAEKQAPWEAEYWYMDGQCEELLGDRKAAVICLRMATSLDSTKSVYLARLGQVYFALAKYDSALSAFSAAEALEEENPSLLFNIGLTLVKMDSIGSAAQSFEAAAKAHHIEKVATVYRQLGALYFTHDKYRKAEQEYRRAVQSDPSNPEGWFFYAICLDKRGKQKEAASAYRKFLDTAKGNSAAQKNWLESARKRLDKIGTTRAKDGAS